MRALPPLSPILNRAVLALAARHWPAGWRAVEQDTQFTVEVGMEAGRTPETWDSWPIAKGAPFPVFAGASDRTIFGAPAVNHAFRAWHDAWHLRLRAPFTAEGERLVWAAQDSELGAWLRAEALYGNDAACPNAYGTVKALLFAEIMGQLEHQTRHGAFPANQRAFVRAFLRAPQRALDRRW